MDSNCNNYRKKYSIWESCFSQEEIPMLVATSEEGIKNLKQEITKEYYELPLVKTEEDKKKIKELIAENEEKLQ